MTLEHAFTCPYCWETITMLIEPLGEVQEYVEDCEVCCNPIAIRFSLLPAQGPDDGDGDGDLYFAASRLEQ